MVGPDGSRKMIPVSMASYFEKAGARRATPQEVQAYRAQKAAAPPAGAGAPPQGGAPMGGLAGGAVPHDIAYSMISQAMKERQAEEGRAATERRTTVPVNATLLKNYPKLAKMGYQQGDVIPQSVFDAMSGQSNKGASLGLRDEQFWEKQWVDTGKELDVTKATSRQPLGIAVTNNQKAGRAMKLLDSKKTFTPQDLSLITTDLTAMMKGGSPDEELLRQQQYPSYYQSGVNLLQRITNKPQELNSPEVKQHLREIVQGIVEVDNQVIRDHVDSVESSRSDVIARRPKDWEQAKAKALKHVLEDKKEGKGDSRSVEDHAAAIFGGN